MAAPTKRTLAAIIGAVAAAAAIAFTGSNEGISNTPYRDAGGVWTVCRGQTGVAMKYYTDAQCDAMLADRLATDAAAIAQSTPNFAALPDGVKTATVDFVYNVGIGAYNGSSYRRRLLADDVSAACGELLKWRFVAGHDCSVRSNGCYGVWTRRQAEKEMCDGKLR